MKEKGKEMKKKIEELAAEERREYFRQWRLANKEKVKKHSSDYWKRKAARKLAKQEEK